MNRARASARGQGRRDSHVARALLPGIRRAPSFRAPPDLACLRGARVSEEDRLLSDHAKRSASPTGELLSRSMGQTCYLCEMGRQAVLGSGLESGEGFGTCRDCSVHACPKHGERSAQFFRCADCVAADAGSSALTSPAGGDPRAVRGAAPRLSVLATPIRTRIDARRMAAAVAWVRDRIAANETLLVASDAANQFDNFNPADLLALPLERGDREAAVDEAVLRAELLETQVHAAVTAAMTKAPETIGDSGRTPARSLRRGWRSPIAHAARKRRIRAR
jgi:hypothetical protein